MAYVELRPVRKNLSYTLGYAKDAKKTAREPELAEENDELMEVMGYARNADKTEKELYVTGVNCDADTAVEEFIQVQKQFGKEGKGIIAHHGWQSFHKNENVDPDQVHKIGVELAKAHFGDRFQVIVTTHLNKEHLHNHFVVNAVSFADGKKYYSNKESLRELRKKSDELCLKYGLSIIENPKLYGKDKGLYRAEAEGRPVWRTMMKADIDDAISGTVDFRGFLKEMQKRGYLYKQGKHFAFSPPGFEKEGRRAFIRLRSLKDEAYTLEGIQNRLADNNIRNYGFAPIRKVKRTRKQISSKRKLPHYMAVYYRYMYKLGLMKRKPRRINRYIAKKGQREAAKLNEKIRYIKAHGIYDETDLAEQSGRLKQNIHELEKKRKIMHNRRYRHQDVDEEELGSLTKEIQDLKKELRICESIAVKPTLPDSEPKKVKAEAEQKKKDEVKENERRSRSR